MDELDIWSIQSLIESRTGKRGRPYDVGDDPNVVLDALLKFRPTLPVPSQRSFTVFMVEGGVSDLFTLSGFSRSVICYHIGYVGKFIKCRNYIMEDPATNTIDHLGMAILFEMMSEFYLHSGNSSFATTCLLQSIIQTPTRTPDRVVYDYWNHQLNASLHFKRQVVESAFSLLFFGLAHEIGHAYAEDCVKHGTNVHYCEIADSDITQAVLEAGKDADISFGSSAASFA